MSFIAFLLLLASAFLHAGWNLVCKRQHPTQAFFLMTSVVGAALLLPVPICYWSRIPHIPPVVWLLLLVTGFFMALYYVALAGAYRMGHMSIAQA